MRGVLVAAMIGAALLASSASAYDGSVKGNDTGGIFPWSCESEAWALEIAAQHCAGFGKYPRITSVHRQYGDYIAFACLWTPYIGRFQLPGEATRSQCKTPPPATQATTWQWPTLQLPSFEPPDWLRPSPR
jgi:hypothetical protein